MNRRVTALRRLLTSGDGEAIRQGLTLAAGIDDADVFSQLIDGATAPARVDADITKFGRFPSIGRNAVFEADGIHTALLDLALVHLIAVSDHSLRQELRSLAIGAPTSASDDVTVEVWLDGLERLENLTHLDLWLPQSQPVSLAPLEAFPALRFLRVRGARMPPALPPMATLERLEVGRLSLTADAAYPRLRTVRGWFDAPDGLDGSQLPVLEDVDARNGLALRNVARLGQVRLNKGHYELPGCEEIDALHTANAGSVDAADLRRIGTLDGVCRGLDVSRLDRLGKVRIHGQDRFSGGTFPPETELLSPTVMLRGPELVTLGNLGELSGLETLHLIDVTAPLDLETLRHAHELKVLDLRGSTGITDLGALVGHASIEQLIVAGSGVAHVPEPLRALVVESPNGAS